MHRAALCLAILFALASAPASSSPTITVLAPAAGERLVPGQVVSVRWQATGVARVELGLVRQRDGGSLAWAAPFPLDLPAEPGEYEWQVPGCIQWNAAQDLELRVASSSDETIHGRSGPFRISAERSGESASRPVPSGSLRVHGGEGVDIDAGVSTCNRADGVDVQFHFSALHGELASPYLFARDGTVLAHAPPGSRDPGDCAAGEFSRRPISLQDLEPGAAICVSTGEGNLSRVTVEVPRAARPGLLTLTHVTRRGWPRITGSPPGSSSRGRRGPTSVQALEVVLDNGPDGLALRSIEPLESVSRWAAFYDLSRRPNYALPLELRLSVGDAVFSEWFETEARLSSGGGRTPIDPIRVLVHVPTGSRWHAGNRLALPGCRFGCRPREVSVSWR